MWLHTLQYSDGDTGQPVSIAAACASGWHCAAVSSHLRRSVREPGAGRHGDEKRGDARERAIWHARIFSL